MCKELKKGHHKELSEDMLEKVDGGGNNKGGEKKICPDCNQEYTGEWGKHKTSDCPVR